MRLLLDTHIFLWSVVGSPQLSQKAQAIIQGADEVFVSAASMWEIAIKISIGKLAANPHQLLKAIPQSGFIELPVTALHASNVANLPAYHNDPFDRLLVAQALAEPMHLITADAQLSNYTKLVIHI